MRLRFGFVAAGMFLCIQLPAQKVDCNTLDINKVPGKWIWQATAPSFQDQIPATQWKVGEPIRKELQRILPVAPDGIYATNSIAFPKGKAFWHSPSPAAYECYLMVKGYECLKGYNILQPEGATGCWMYVAINTLDGVKFPLPCDGTSIKYHAYESDIRITNIEVQTDAAGNKIIYSQYKPDIQRRHCYFFSGRKGLPWRKLTNKELFLTYKLYFEKQFADEIPKREKLVADYEKTYNSLTPAEKEKKDYRWQQLESGRNLLNNLKRDREKLVIWYKAASNHPALNDTAYVTKVNAYEFSPDDLEATPGNGYNVWVDNLDYFDKTKPRDEAQCIAFYVIRQDDVLPKKNFMDIFFSQFNLDVLAKMTGESAKKPNGINSMDAALTANKETTNAAQAVTGPVRISFDQTTDGAFPTGWFGMKNIGVQSNGSNKWMAMTKDGYWYPRQYNKEIKNNFSLGFDLQWNSDIAYNSGSFTVTLGEIEYDKVSERYKLDDNQAMYWSLYDSYVGNFNRVVLWFDPYWNGGGTLTVYSYDNRENVKFSKRITLPDFYKEKNTHQLKIQRNGNGLVVTDNGKTIADLPGVFLPTATYNLYTFSRYKGNMSDNKNDVFLLKDIEAIY
ncbi:MAG: hypothetical protein NTW29_03370 [Bacteroidetes bacterium]|nr:hypothetical protein [Bacteroidota bacterium]